MMEDAERDQVTSFAGLEDVLFRLAPQGSVRTLRLLVASCLSAYLRSQQSKFSKPGRCSNDAGFGSLFRWPIGDRKVQDSLPSDQQKPRIVVRREAQRNFWHRFGRAFVSSCELRTIRTVLCLSRTS